MKEKLIKVLTFSAVCIFLWIKMDIILERYDNWWDHSGMDNVYKNSDFYDIIFVGTSITITNISNEELYLEYGISGVTIGAPSQPTYLSYYALKEALKHQSPKVVMFDVNSLFYTEEQLKEYAELDEQHYLHYTLDGMKNNVVKYEAYRQAKKLNSQLEFWNYFSPIYYNHSNWEDLKKENFERNNSSKMNGNLMLMSSVENWNGSTSTLPLKRETEELEDIPEFNEQYLEKMINICSENGISFVLIRGGGEYTWGKYNKICDIAKKYNIPYIDLYDYEKQISFNLKEDSWDGIHFNVIGAKKWTIVLGRYFINNFECEDRRFQSEYDLYRRQEIFYSGVVKAMTDRILLSRSLRFDDYIKSLQDIDLCDTTIFVSIKDNGSARLTENEIVLLNELGLSAELREKDGYSYIAVIEETDIQEKLDKTLVRSEGLIGKGIKYIITSGGYMTGNQASIMINGVETIAGGRGINIVVYNSTINQVISSVYFDMLLYENPPTSRISNFNQEQYEVDFNSWLPLVDYQIGEAQ